jgi:allantoinase
MTLAPGRFDYAPITERPMIKWPGNARVAFWVAPNMEHFEYLPENRPTQPDIPHYSRMDYGNRVGFWRMLDVLNRNKVRACCCLNLEVLDHFPEIKEAMVAADWDYMAHGLYNSRPIYDYTEEQERAYWQDFVTHLREMTGKRLKGRLGGGAGYTVRTDDLMAEAGCLYHTSCHGSSMTSRGRSMSGVARSSSTFRIPVRPTMPACWPGIARRITSCR